MKKYKKIIVREKKLWEKKYGEKKYGKKVREKKYGKKVQEKKYGKKVRGKSHVTSGDVTSGQACARYHFWLLPIGPPQI